MLHRLQKILRRARLKLQACRPWVGLMSALAPEVRFSLSRLEKRTSAAEAVSCGFFGTAKAMPTQDYVLGLEFLHFWGFAPRHAGAQRDC
jgi:hypothetical protein